MRELIHPGQSFGTLLALGITHDTLLLRDAFAGLFFVSLGMLFNPMILINEPVVVLATLAIIVFGESTAALLLVRLFGYSKRTTLTISTSLA